VAWLVPKAAGAGEAAEVDEAGSGAPLAGTAAAPWGTGPAGAGSPVGAGAEEPWGTGPAGAGSPVGAGAKEPLEPEAADEEPWADESGAGAF